MPVAVTTAQANKTERGERLLAALKVHILKERQRKKEEHEAVVEEERQRKEREARERQDVMTLGETREQIQKLDLKLKELINQKQQLFLQLKKVLNEDENRKKQQQQKESEILAMHAMPPQNSTHAQIFQQPRPTHPPILQKTGAPVGIANQPIKRGRSPSPPPQANYYKSVAYSPSPKHEDSRSRANEMGARVLWKPTQYPPSQGIFYQTTSVPDSRTQPLIYPSYNPNLSMPLRQNYHLEMPQPPPSQAHPQKSDQPPKSAQIYHINVEQPPQPPPSSNPSSQPGSGPPPSHKSGPPPSQVTMDKMQQERGYHVEMKMDPSHPPPPGLPEGVVYAPMMAGHPGMHPVGKWEMPLQAPNQGQNAKTAGSITQGYPSRVPPGHSQPPPMQAQQQQQPPPSSQQIHYTRRLY